MESFVRVAYRILCKFHLLYDSAFLINHFDTITRQEEEEEERNKIKFENIANLNLEQSQQSRRRRRGSRFRWKLAFISHFIKFRILYHIALWIFDSQISARMQVLLLNLVALEQFDSYIQIFLILYLALVHDMLHLIYVRNRGLTFRVLREAIVKNGNSFFLESRFRFSNWIVRFGVGPDDLISKQLLTLGIWLSNISSLIFSLFHLYFINLAITQLRTNHCFSSLDHYGLFGLSLTLYLVTIHLFSHIFLLTTINGILMAIAAYIIVTQTERFASRNFPRPGSSTNLITPDFPVAEFHRFRAVTVSTLQYLADANRIYGKAFFNFILTSVPFNSLLIGMLFTGQLRDDSIRMIVFVIIGLQIYVMLVLHIGAVVLCRRFHRSVKYFFPFIADPELRVRASISKHSPKSKQAAILWRRFTLREIRSNTENETVKPKSDKKSDKFFQLIQQQQQRRQKISLRLRLQIARYIEYFHTSKQYTANYGKYGAVTYATIKMQIFINIKLILFSYMLYQSKKKLLKFKD